jgi:hypothetical protein
MKPAKSNDRSMAQNCTIACFQHRMKRRRGHKGYVIEVRSCELRDGGFSAEFSVEEHEADGVMETEFYLPDTFPTQESAIEAGIQAWTAEDRYRFRAGIGSRERMSR